MIMLRSTSLVTMIDPETVVTRSGSIIRVDFGNGDMKNEKLINKLKELGLKQTADFIFIGYNH